MSYKHQKVRIPKMATGNHTNQSPKMSQIFKMSQTLCFNEGGGGACRDSIKGKLGRIN